MINPSKIKKTLFNIIDDMDRHAYLFSKRPGIDFSRHSKLPFGKMLSLIISMQGQSLNKELRRYFQYSPHVPKASAFVQQRSKILDGTFEFLFKEFNQCFPSSYRFRGYDILATDGSDFDIPFDPSDPATFIKNCYNTGFFSQYHVSFLFNTFDRRFVDCVIHPRNFYNENSALYEMMKRYHPDHKTIIIADRGYSCFNTIAHFQQSEFYYLIRGKDIYSESSAFKHSDLPDSEEFDIDMSFDLTRSQRKKYKEHPERYKYLPVKTQFDFIDPNDKNSIFTIHFRMVKIKLSDNSYEYLLTNLPREDFAIDDMKYLYWKRWKIETAIDKYKYDISAVNFHSKKREFIIQEIWARMILYNYCILIAFQIPINNLKKYKHERQISYKDAIDICRKYLHPHTYLKNKTLIQLLLRYIHPVRPDRKVPRKTRRSRRFTPFTHRIA